MARAKAIVTGHRGIDRKLRELGRAESRKAVSRGMRAGAKVTRDAVRAEAPRGESGRLGRATMAIRAAKKRALPRGGLGINVYYTGKRFHADQPDKGRSGERPGRWRGKKKRPRTTPFYPLVVEFGEGAIGRPPDPFIRRGHERSRGAAREAMRRATLAEIKAAVRRMKAR